MYEDHKVAGLLASNKLLYLEYLSILDKVGSNLHYNHNYNNIVIKIYR